MPNIRAMALVPNTSVTLTASDGRTITITKAQVQAWYATTSGNVAARTAATITLAKNAIVAALGAEQIDAALIDLTLTQANGITSHGVRS